MSFILFVLYHSIQKYTQEYHDIIIMSSPPDSAICGSMSSSKDNAPPSRHTICPKGHKFQSKLNTTAIPVSQDVMADVIK
mmetsp:Transcript_22133/g.35981  ORF Transcript_22133/g.35981 Transcript_22133/m.35981 type:complete len:80 (-) Transcript_22133:173-412(-)|eukprot:CAMPEP_0196131418 /NCGR_PEP_ID=MMETSP0910-20130528/1436_1 /TAXON_ID=49265 /ORGANISM="Thalassiosira rotula, Strain GSO102" /LENGTH=79 /DNA_ID=CAMNT_0041390883 /DNA_START=294 /DNA_END=533 /DNA_ORIENTATION=-